MGSAPPESKLFEPLQIGKMKLSNRVVMAPLTRFRAEDTHEHQWKLAQEYYGQRAEGTPGTLLITEATFISARASGYDNVPGIWNEEQIASWKPIVDCVHKAGSYIYCQLWSIGRTASPDVLKKEGNGELHAPSAIPQKEGAPVPREMTEDEIQAYITEFAQAAKNALAAGFDGVEIHGANGYLPDQFLQDVSNHRTDAWGGSMEKRARFPFEVTKACVDAIGADRVGIRLSPFSDFQGMKMKDPIPQFSYLVKELAKLRLAYIHLVEARISGNTDVESTEKLTPLMEAYGKTSPVLIAGGFKPDSAKEAVDHEYAKYDVGIVFGRLFISNPDLVFRMQRGIPLEQYDRSKFYVPKSPVGYIDSPFSSEWKKEHGIKDEGAGLPVQP